MKETYRLRSILFGCTMPLLFATVSFGRGEYQSTTDNKTIIWNGTPKSGETSTWSGDRDKENYASGFGDLTWYNAKGKIYALYYGNMVHGKFEGPVNVHSSGRTAHAYFVDGERVTAWARGPASSKENVPEEAMIERRKAEAQKTEGDRAERRELSKSPSSVSSEPPKKPKTEPEKEHAIASKPEAKPEKSEVTLVEKSAPEAMKEEAPPAAAEKNSEDATMDSPTRAFHEPMVFPTSEPDRPLTEQKTEVTSQSSEVSGPTPTAEKVAKGDEENIDRPTPNIAALEKTPIESTAAEHQIAESSAVSHPSATKSPADVSASALVGPPSSLHTISIPDSAPEKSETLSSTSENSPLTETEAVSLADTEARIQGYQPDDYERPKVDYSKVKGKWSLFYGLKKVEPGSDKPAMFTVTVEDKTRKVEIRK